jgi:hypothetical protein
MTSAETLATASVHVLVADLGLSDGQGDTLGLEATGEESR